MPQEATTMFKPIENCDVILGNSNKRFSGVTSTMLQTLTYQQEMMSIGVLGHHHLDGQLKHLGLSFKQVLDICKKPLASGKHRIFHARRNDEMIQALIIKHIFRRKIKILFTSTAQRYHSGFSRWLMSKMDCVISTCQAAANYLTCKPKALVAHGINTETYFPETNKNNGNELCVAMFGRVRKQKGSHLFVRACIAAFPQHPNASAKIIGAITSENSDFVASLKQEIADAGLSDRIQFLGEHDFENIPGLFRQSDIVAALSSTEGFGLTILEAMASGAAVLATEAGAWPEIIEQGVHGWVVPVNDQDAITAKLDLLLQNPAKLKEMGKAGRERVLSHYRIEDEAKKLCAIYQEMQTQL